MITIEKMALIFMLFSVAGLAINTGVTVTLVLMVCFASNAALFLITSSKRKI